MSERLKGLDRGSRRSNEALLRTAGAGEAAGSLRSLAAIMMNRRSRAPRRYAAPWHHATERLLLYVLLTRKKENALRTRLPWMIAVGSTFCVVTAAEAAAQQKRSPTARAMPTLATVEGDAYLVMKNGDTKRGSGRTIYLLREPDSVRARVAAVCAAIAPINSALDKEFKAIHEGFASLSLPQMDAALKRSSFLTDSMSRLRTYRDARILQIIAASVADTVGTGMNAHFAFSAVKPGEYALFGEWTIMNNRYRWWAPISVTKAALRRDLDNSVEAEGAFTCSRGLP